MAAARCRCAPRRPAMEGDTNPRETHRRLSACEQPGLSWLLTGYVAQRIHPLLRAAHRSAIGIAVPAGPEAGDLQVSLVCDLHRIFGRRYDRAAGHATEFQGLLLPVLGRRDRVCRPRPDGALRSFSFDVS